MNWKDNSVLSLEECLVLIAVSIFSLSAPLTYAIVHGHIPHWLPVEVTGSIHVGGPPHR